MASRFLLRPSAVVLILAVVIGVRGRADAQNFQLPAGVEVDAQGTLRMKRFPDPTGELTKQRLAQMKSALPAELSRPSKLRKISLNRLEAAINESLSQGAGLSDEMRFLAGMTKIQYVFAYPETGDLVIAGPAEGYGQDLTGRVIGLTSGQSILELQDLIVALRAFPPQGDAAPVISCSIDPTAEGLARMQQYIASVSGRVRPGDADQYAIGMREHLGPQVVTVEGVSPKTHFAQVLVEADYRMKLIGIGLETTPVRITSYIQRANPNDVARNALQRWYFVPDYDAIRVSRDGLAMELVGKGVKLVGENEMVSVAGGRSQANFVDRASQAFVTSFTNRYNELASKVPVYGQLRNLIDLAITAAFIQEADLYRQAGWAMATFGSEDALPVETYAVPTHVESAINVVWKGNVLMTPIGGGVSIQPRLALSSDRVQEDEAGAIAETQAANAVGQLDAGQWWWD